MQEESAEKNKGMHRIVTILTHFQQKANTQYRRYHILFAFAIFFVLASFLVRAILMLKAPETADLTLFAVFRIFVQGAVFDLGVAVFLSAVYSFYLLLIPERFNRSWLNKLVTYGGFLLVLFIVLFSFFAELTFWQEFESRFNFIAVDYLIYTYEVVNNINESYPLPWLIGGMLVLTALIFFAFYKWNIFEHSFNSATPFLTRGILSGVIILLAFVYGICVDNDQAELSHNHYQNELSKAGIYSFVSAFKKNELSYDQYYRTIDSRSALAETNNSLVEDNVVFENPMSSVRRTVRSNHLVAKPNVIMITIESLSADLLGAFGNKQGITPFMDSLAENGLLFTNMYATGTRTVRGMEALSLSIPPTPGSSIVRRPGNRNLFTVGTIFKNAGYDRTFLYGGDGYFDNMNQYFSGNGFDVTDRGRKITVGDTYKTKRTIIKDSLVNFENAWGICDEDLYDAVIRSADEKYGKHHSFYQFVMTTSNHRPYTYPPGKIDIPPGSGRDGAVKYTDFAIRQLFQKMKNRPWYANTVVILVADHCASSAGKNEIDISKYHIPCIVVNLPGSASRKIEKLCSQIDLYPTLFNILGWNYRSNMFGKNVLEDDYVPRAVLGTYQQLAYLRNDSLVVLGPRQVAETFLYSKTTNEQVPNKLPPYIVNDAIAQYQTAYSLFKNGGLKE